MRNKEKKDLLARKLETKGKSDSYVIARTVIIAVILLVIFVIAVFIKPKAVTEFLTVPFSYMIFIIFMLAVTLVSKKDEVYCL